jgi:translation elongation factor EF-Ts
MTPMTVEQLKDLVLRFPEAGFLRCRKAFEASEGDVDRAALLLASQGHASAEEVARRPPSQGLQATCTFQGVTVRLVLQGETRENFVTSPVIMAHADGLAMHVASRARSSDLEPLNDQSYFLDPNVTVGELLKELSDIVGGRVYVSEYEVRYAWVNEEEDV